MGWTAPRTWVAGEIVTAALMNAHVRDNTRYLKGLDGVPTIESGVIIDNTGGDEYLQIPSLTTGERNALTPVNGMMVYNETTAEFNKYEGSAWLNFSGGGITTITFIIDGGGAVITTGQKGHLEIPFACTIQRATTLADQSGSIVVDIWKDTYANFPPTDADSITSAAPPTLAGATNAQDSTLTNWTTAIAAGDILAYNVDSVATVTRVTISLKVIRI